MHFMRNMGLFVVIGLFGGIQAEVYKNKHTEAGGLRLAFNSAFNSELSSYRLIKEDIEKQIFEKNYSSDIWWREIATCETALLSEFVSSSLPTFKIKFGQVVRNDLTPLERNLLIDVLHQFSSVCATSQQELISLAKTFRNPNSQRNMMDLMVQNAPWWLRIHTGKGHNVYNIFLHNHSNLRHVDLHNASYNRLRDFYCMLFDCNDYIHLFLSLNPIRYNPSDSIDIINSFSHILTYLSSVIDEPLREEDIRVISAELTVLHILFTELLQVIEQ